MPDLISPSRRRFGQKRSGFKEFISNRSSQERGLTRVEVLAVLAALVLLACVALPALANTRQRSDRLACVSNLRRIGQAFHAWAADHGDRMMWVVPSTEEGTTWPPGSPPPPWGGLQNLAYFQYSWISNQLVSPKYLVCPADASKRVARNWGSTDPNGGFRHNNQQNNSVSYSLGLHAWPERPEGFMAGDRNFGYDAVVTTCSTGITPTREIQPATTVAAWLPTIHGTNGNLLLYDGRVEQVDTSGLRKVFLKYAPQGAEPEHYLFPQ
jgi:competence protein ComGC